MKKNVLPNTSLEVSHLGFGTASLHHLVRSRDRKSLLAVAMDSGFTHFDTAPMYGEGMAERELGRFLKVARKQVTIATKVGFPTIAAFQHLPPLLYAHRALSKIGQRILPGQWNYRPRNLRLESVEQSLFRSLKALRTDWIDLLMVHEPHSTDVDALLRLVQWLERQKASGCIRYLGLAGSAICCVKMNRQIPGLFDVLQVEDSLVKKEADTVIADGLPMQITFGYMRSAADKHSNIDGQAIIKAALARNVDGMILASSRYPDRLKMLASLAE